MQDHTGLRGIMSIWIVVFHGLLYTVNPIEIQGSSLMPMFFMLSGFSLTVTYYTKLLGKQPQVPTTEESSQNDKLVKASKESGPTITYIQFIVNRLLRVLPVYYLCNLITIPAVLHGYGRLNPDKSELLRNTMITTFIPTSSWFGFLYGVPLDVAAWTVQTLIACWLCFPFILRYLHSWTDTQLLATIRWFYWIQFWICFVGTFFLLPRLELKMAAFCFGTMSPYSRIWCFVMGMAAGILCLRYRDQEFMPWFTDSTWFVPVRSLFSSSPWHNKFTAKYFENTMFQQTYMILFATCSVTILDAILRRRNESGRGLMGAIWFQALVPFCQLNIMISMTRHHLSSNVSTVPTNLISRVLRHPVTMWLGELSMSIYLLHFPIQYYVLWILRGKSHLQWPSDIRFASQYNKQTVAACIQAGTCPDASFYDDISWPQWSFIVLPILSILIAWLLYNWIEKPISKWKY
jgi:peptidoglycan/LPS O-acetylase OafA/YrhL